MALGSPQTSRFSIGTAELRVGPLTEANKLTQAHSVGLVDNVTITVEQETAQLQGGFPRKLVDEAIVSQTTQITATLREYSRRNINLMLGNGVLTGAVTDVASLLVTTELAGSVAFDVTAGDGSTFTAGQLIVVYPEGRPENVSVVKIASIATDTITLDADTPLLFAYDGTVDTIHVYVAHELAIGAVTKTNYFAVSVVQQDLKSGRPIVFNFWKGSIASGMEYGTSAEDYASTEITISLLEPTACEYGVGGDLEHLASIIPTNPIGIFAAGADGAAC